MDIPTIKAETRKAAGSRAAARLRRAGKLPAVVYGHQEAPLAVALDNHEMEKHLSHGAHVLQLDLGGRNQPVLIKDAQYDHLGMALLHVDLTRVDLNEKVKVRVPLELRGTPKGVAEGGVLRQDLGDLEVECLATNIPEKVRIDVSEMALDAVLYVKDLKLDAGLTAAGDLDAVVATCRVPVVKTEEPAAAPAEGASAEPEVIAKGKVEEAPEEGAKE